MKKIYQVEESCDSMRLDRYLRTKIGIIPQSLIEKNLRNGKIKLNSRKIKSSIKVKSNDKIEFFNFVFEMEYYNDLTGVITNIGAGELEIKLSKPIQPPGGADPGLTSINLFQEEGDFSMISKL